VQAKAVDQWFLRHWHFTSQRVCVQYCAKRWPSECHYFV